MQLVLRRVEGPRSTPGYLEIDGEFFCWTLEDPVRPEHVKVPGDTAIPYGRYPVRRTYSFRFQRVMPAIENVPMFSGIRIHPGNTVEDTEGCVLVGEALTEDGMRLVRSRAAYDRLDALLEQAEARGEQNSIDIRRAEDGAG